MEFRLSITKWMVFACGYAIAKVTATCPCWQALIEHCPKLRYTHEHKGNPR